MRFVFFMMSFLFLFSCAEEKPSSVNLEPTQEAEVVEEEYTQTTLTLDIQKQEELQPQETEVSSQPLDLSSILDTYGFDNTSDTTFFEGYSILHEIAEIGDLKSAEFLLAGMFINVDVRGSDGLLDRSTITPVHVAVDNNQIDMVKLLVKYGADVNILGFTDRTPLQTAIFRGNLELVKYLAGEAGANPNIQNSYGNTALHMAVSKDRLDIVKYLVEEAGADVNAQNKTGETPLDHADHIVNKIIQSEIAEFLESHGAKAKTFW